MSGHEGAPSGNYNKSPYKYVEGDADFAMICRAAGLDPAQYGTKDYIIDRGMWALMELFSDGELRILAGEDVANRQDTQHRSGADRYGEFYERMADLRSNALVEGDQIADEINKLARYCGTVLATYVEKEIVPLPDSKIASPGVSSISGRALVEFDEYTWQSNKDVAVIMEYGPGINGKQFLDTQLKALLRSQPPFQYIGISDGPFINQFLVTYLGNRLEGLVGKEARQFATSGRLFVGREDGMYQATKELLATPQPSGTHELCDLMLFTGVQEANPFELENAIKESKRLLRTDGRLMISAPLRKVASKTTPFEEQAKWAEEADYKLEWYKSRNTGDRNLGTNTVSGLAVFRK